MSGVERLDDLNKSWVEAHRIAQEFHMTYERLAPEYGYETREDSRTDWDQLPAANRDLMVGTAHHLLISGAFESPPHTQESALSGSERSQA